MTISGLRRAKLPSPPTRTAIGQTELRSCGNATRVHQSAHTQQGTRTVHDGGAIGGVLPWRHAGLDVEELLLNTWGAEKQNGDGSSTTTTEVLTGPSRTHARTRCFPHREREKKATALANARIYSPKTRSIDTHREYQRPTEHRLPSNQSSASEDRGSGVS